MNEQYDFDDHLSEVLSRYPDTPDQQVRTLTLSGDADGACSVRGLRPVDYPVPMDGPPGGMLRATSREGMRAAHLHVLMTVPRHQSLVTELFDSESDPLDVDDAFGVCASLVRTPIPAPNGALETTFDIVLRPE